jgi:autotransporter-associated beta strand protein
MKTMQRMAVAILAVMAGTNAGAANPIKTDTTTMNVAASWSDSAVPTSSKIGEFNNVISSGKAATLTLGGNVSVLGLLFDSNLNGPVKIGSGSTLSLYASGIDMSAANANVTIGCATALAADQTWNVGSGLMLTNSGILSGNYNLNKTGAGTLTLTGANTFSGTTTINNGKVKLGGATALQNSAYDTTGSTGAIGLDVTDYATPTLGGLAGSVDLATAITGYSGVTGLPLNPQAGVTVTYGGVIADGSGAMTLTKTGSGTQILTGPNTYSGGTTNTTGTLALGADNVLSTGALVLNGGTLGASGGARLLTNAVTLKVASTVDTTGGAITLAGAVNTNANVALTIVGANALTLTNAMLASINVGQSGTSDGHLVVSNYGSLTASAKIVLNNSGATPSTLFISGGGAVADSLANGLGLSIGDAANASNNYAVVTDAGSALSQPSLSGGYIAVGYGSGAYGNYLIVSNGATATCTIKVGNGTSTSNNYVLVDNATQSGVFNVGNAAGANGNYLIVTNGGYAGSASSISSIGGVGAGTNNYIIVAGTNSAGTRARFQAGYNQPYALEVGAFAGSTGNYLLVGAGGQYMDAQGKSLVIGYVAGANGNYVTVTNGGLIDFTGAGGIIVGYAAATNNYLLVDGSDSLVRAPITVGNVANANSNYVNVTGGGLLEANTIKIGNLASADNTLTVSGGILQFTTATPTITIANYPANALVITNGTVSFRGVNPVNLTNNWVNSGIGTNTVTWLPGGNNTLRLDGSTATNTLGRPYQFNTGFGPTNYVNLEILNTCFIKGAGVSNGVTIGAAGSMLVSNGTVTLTGALTNNGTVTLAGSPAVLMATNTFYNNGLLTGSGVVSGIVTVGSAGTISAGGSNVIGTLTFSTNVVFSGGTNLWTYTGSACDTIQILGKISGSGVIKVDGTGPLPSRAVAFTFEGQEGTPTFTTTEGYGLTVTSSNITVRAASRGYLMIIQ